MKRTHEQRREGAGESKRIAERDAAAAAEQLSKGKPSEKGEELKKELDELLDEIDEVLESNAEAFVNSYVQKNGE